jgi:putative ABC transport system permease protein
MSMHKVGNWVAAAGQDLHFALRLMRRNVEFSAMAIAILALAIGANAAVYSLFDAVVLHPLGYPHPDRLHLVLTVAGRPQRAMVSTSYLNFRDCEQRARGFDRMAAFQAAGFNLTAGGAAERVGAIKGSPGLFETLGVAPALGRTMVPADDVRVVRRGGVPSAHRVRERGEPAHRAPRGTRSRNGHSPRHWRPWRRSACRRCDASAGAFHFKRVECRRSRDRRRFTP